LDSSLANFKGDVDMLLIRRPAERLARAAIGTAVIAGASGVIDQRMNQHYASHTPQAAHQSTSQHVSSVKGLTNQAVAELHTWSELHKQGLVTHEEFAAVKARILGI
jgi:hypothetical protein